MAACLQFALIAKSGKESGRRKEPLALAWPRSFPTTGPGQIFRPDPELRPHPANQALSGGSGGLPRLKEKKISHHTDPVADAPVDTTC